MLRRSIAAGINAITRTRRIREGWQAGRKQFVRLSGCRFNGAGNRAAKPCFGGVVWLPRANWRGVGVAVESSPNAGASDMLVIVDPTEPAAMAADWSPPAFSRGNTTSTASFRESPSVGDRAPDRSE